MKVCAGPVTRTHINHMRVASGVTNNLNHCACLGITTVCDMGTMGNPSDTWDTLENTYMPAADKGQLSLRIFAMVPLPTW